MASVPVLDKYSGEVVEEVVTTADEALEETLVRAAELGQRPLSAADRHDILLRTADLLLSRRDHVEDRYVAETGFTPADASGELDRAVNVLRLSAAEALRIAGEQVPVEATRGSENRLAFTMRVPVGVVAAVAPFNAPLVTVTHKVAPAVAAGNAVVLKPAEQTPLSSLALAEAMADAGLPQGYLQVVTGPGESVGHRLISDPRVQFVTFTGSTEVGRIIRRSCGLARTHLELGSNSATIVADDADLDRVVATTVRAGYRKAGQVCTSIQRLLVMENVVDDLADRLAVAVAKISAGDPRDPAHDIGPLIAEGEADRAADWVERSRGQGTTVVGGDHDGAVMQPTLVVRPRDQSPILSQEIFAPVVAVVPVESLSEAIDAVNAGPYGLQAGVFTQDLDRAFHAARTLKVGGVMVNDSSSYHADAMPYGGVKDSGHGLEGPRYAVQEMTDPRLVVLNLMSGTQEGAW